MIPRLGVNIDHVATLRQARGEEYPSLVEAATHCLEAGADQITIHLREDRRHIQDTDVGAIKLVTDRYGKPLNLEMGCADDIVAIAEETAPGWVCIVPEKREEKTTEGGLDITSTQGHDKVHRTIERIKRRSPQTKISLFVEAQEEVMKKSIELGADAVEIHTGEYARAILNGEELNSHFEKYQQCQEIIKKAGLNYHAGHGLTLESLNPLLTNKYFEEYNIGHWIICRAVFEGLTNIVGMFKQEMEKYPL